MLIIAFNISNVAHLSVKVVFTSRNIFLRVPV